MADRTLTAITTRCEWNSIDDTRTLAAINEWLNSNCVNGFIRDMNWTPGGYSCTVHFVDDSEAVAFALHWK